MQALASALDGFLTQHRVRFISVAVLVVVGALAVLSFATAKNNRTIFGIQLGADYAAFYGAGQILNEYPPGRLYDMELQRQVFRELHPEVSANAALPYANPPFLALPFRLLAKLPYAPSFVVWLLVSATFYLGALALMWRMTNTISRDARITGLLLALSFEPFIMECWLGGQLSAIGLFCCALALDCERRNRPFAAGMVLGLCLYKPTLLVLVAPLLFIGRRYRTLAGMTATAGGLAVVSLLGVGWDGCRDYGAVLTNYAHATVGGPMTFRTWKFVDVMSFCRQLGGGGWWALAPVLAVWPLWCLVEGWRARPADATSLWAGTLTLTLVLNLYVGIYDCVLVVLAVMLTAARFSHRTDRLLLALVYVTPWFSQYLARETNIQLFTLVLLALGVSQLPRAPRRLGLQ